MQDITPPNRASRKTLRVPVRDTVAPVVISSRPVESIYYTRQTKIINDVAPHQEVIVTETFTTTYEPATEPTPMVKAIEHLSPEAKSDVLQKALFNAERDLKRERRKRKDLKRFGFIFVTSVFVLATGYVSIDSLITNNRVKAETNQSTPAAESAVTTKASEGKDETPITAAHLADYSVASNLPRALYIDKLHIASRIMPMSVNNDGSVQAPRNIFDAGWYNGSVKPGEIGAMFIDGHASGPTREGLFAYLDTLEEGDQIQVEKGDNTHLTYKVVHKETVPLSEVNMKQMLLPYGNALRGLNLMTCTGTWIDSAQTYDQRVLIWTEQV